MKTTIDGGGRVVIPKRVRDRLSLRAGDELEIEELDDRVVISRAARDVGLVETSHGLLAADPAANLPGFGPDQVRELLERTRR